LSDIILPNTHKLWEKGVSLDLYSRDYDYYAEKQNFTKLGKSVHDYKYKTYFKGIEKQELLDQLTDVIINFLKLNNENQERTFNSCIAVPSNRKEGNSLPNDLALNLSKRINWLQDQSSILFKNRELPIMKNISDPAERIKILKGAYSVNESISIDEVKGFLVIDDIYHSGATVREVCRTLKKSIPSVPRYVLTVTHLKAVWTERR
jgi:predicted amidophosphoribosyltransferase